MVIYQKLLNNKRQPLLTLYQVLVFSLGSLWSQRIAGNRLG